MADGKLKGKSNTAEAGGDRREVAMNDKTAQATRRIGWLLIIAGLLAIAGIAVFSFLFTDETPVWMKFIMIAVYGGLAFLLFSVLRQRLIERKADRYKDVEI